MASSCYMLPLPAIGSFSCFCMSVLEVAGDGGSVFNVDVLACPTEAILNAAAFQHGVLADKMRSSIVIPVFKKSYPANYQPVAFGEPLCRLLQPPSISALSAGLWAQGPWSGRSAAETELAIYAGAI